MSLFRQAALDAQRHQSLGSIVLIRPVSFGAFAAVAIACASLILAFFFVGEYTKRAQVIGLLVPDAGLIKVSSPVPGVVIAQHVKEGQKVQAGQVLFVLNAEKQLSQANGTALSLRKIGGWVITVLSSLSLMSYPPIFVIGFFNSCRPCNWNMPR